MMGILLRGRQAGRHTSAAGEPATSPVQTYTCAGGLGVCAQAQSPIIPVVAGLKTGLLLRAVSRGTLKTACQEMNHSLFHKSTKLL